jgi:vancomycin resistance protein YoaR
VEPRVQEASSTKKPFTKTVWYWVLMVLGGLVALCAIVVLADAAIYYGKVHDGVSVYGVDLAGKTRAEATAAVSSLVQSIESKPITLTYGDRTWTITPADLGTKVDVDAAVNAAFEESRVNNLAVDVVHRFELYFDPVNLTLPAAVDQVKVQDFVTSIAAELHQDAVNADLAIDGISVKVLPSQDAHDVDQANLVSQLDALLLGLHTAALDVPVVVTPPAVHEADNQDALQKAQAILSGPITLTDHEKSWTLSTQEIAGLTTFRLDYTSGARVLVPYVSLGRLMPFLQTLAPEVKYDPVNAALNAGSGENWTVVPSVDGQTLDPMATADAVEAAALQAQPSARKIPVGVSVVEADFTTAEAQSETFKDLLGSYTTKYACPPNRATNVRITTQYATNVFLAPGQEYNFDKQIGPRTEARGYKLAPGITGPNTLEDVLGGGICQVSTTMFNAVFEAGLEVTERHNHSIYINHYPKGRDATVTGGGKNLRFKNDTGHYIWIRGTSNGITTTISIYGTSDGRKVTWKIGAFYDVKSPTVQKINDPTLPVGTTKSLDAGQTGRKLKTWRTVTLPDGTVLWNDVWTSYWPMYPKQVLVGTKPVGP